MQYPKSVECAVGTFSRDKFVPRDERRPRPRGQRAEEARVIAYRGPDACNYGIGWLMVVVPVLPHILAAGPLGDVELAQAARLR
jgi:hypothetical protein